MNNRLYSVTCVLCGAQRYEPAPRQGAFSALLRQEGWRRDRRLGWICPADAGTGDPTTGLTLADLKPRLRELVARATPGIHKVVTDAHPDGHHSTWWVEKERGAGGRGTICLVQGPLGAPEQELAANAHLFAIARVAITLLLEENELAAQASCVSQGTDQEDPCTP